MPEPRKWSKNRAGKEGSKRSEKWGAVERGDSYPIPGIGKGPAGWTGWGRVWIGKERLKKSFYPTAPRLQTEVA